MHFDIAYLGVVISLGALAVAIYGIFERGQAADRAERIRLTSIVDDLAQSRADLLDRGRRGELNPHVVEAIHGRTSVLCQQAFSLMQGHPLAVTSSECREVAYHLEDAGFDSDADTAWQLAQSRAELEGKVQELFAGRGYAYFLFRRQRPDEARELLQSALSGDPDANDRDRVFRAQTLNDWASHERALDGPLSLRVVELSRQMSAVAASCDSAWGRDQLQQLGIQFVLGQQSHGSGGETGQETGPASGGAT